MIYTHLPGKAPEQTKTFNLGNSPKQIEKDMEALKEGTLYERPIIPSPLKRDVESPVEELERLYPELAENFKVALNLQYRLFAEKHLAYGFENISLGGDLSKPKANKFSLTGLWFRLNDKMNRFKNIAINDAFNYVKDESMIDIFMDMANYAIIAKLVLQDKWE
jgi:hypothetical protein